MVDGEKICRFEDLRVWQDAMDFAIVIYTLTKQCPKDEQYGLVSQMRRAASSVSADIAEGFGRRSSKDKAHFYTMAYGSVLEVRNFIHLSIKLGYTDVAAAASILDKSVSLQKQLNALIRTIRV